MLLPPLTPATFLTRLNRFAVLVEIVGVRVPAHLPNSGRLEELLVSGRRAYVARAGRRARQEVPLPWPPSAAAKTEDRRTSYDLVLVNVDGTLVSCDARLPPTLVAEAVARNAVPGLKDYAAVRREPPLAEGRADLLVEGQANAVLIETKSITLVEEGTGLFPDAPTERGARHVRALAAHIREQGRRAMVVFVVQRSDVRAVRPNDATDPAFGKALREAVAAGVEAVAVRCDVSVGSVRVAASVPVLL